MRHYRSGSSSIFSTPTIYISGLYISSARLSTATYLPRRRRADNACRQVQVVSRRQQNDINLARLDMPQARRSNDDLIFPQKHRETPATRESRYKSFDTYHAMYRHTISELINRRRMPIVFSPGAHGGPAPAPVTFPGQMPRHAIDIGERAILKTTQAIFASDDVGHGWPRATPRAPGWRSSRA